MHFDKLLILAENIKSAIPHWEEKNLRVSQVNVGWHIEHILIATIIITEQLLKSDPANYKWHFNKSRLIVFGLNRIPRGKAKAPKSVLPKENSSLLRIEKFMEIAKEKIYAIEHLNPNSFIIHPYLGLLNHKSSIRFMCIHAKHHLKIINEILNPS